MRSSTYPQASHFDALPCFGTHPRSCTKNSGSLASGGRRTSCISTSVGDEEGTSVELRDEKATGLRIGALRIGSLSGEILWMQLHGSSHRQVRPCLDRGDEEDTSLELRRGRGAGLRIGSLGIGLLGTGSGEMLWMQLHGPSHRQVRPCLDCGGEEDTSLELWGGRRTGLWIGALGIGSLGIDGGSDSGPQHQGYLHWHPGPCWNCVDEV